MTVKLWTSLFALILVVGVVLAPAVAQRAKEGASPGPADDQLTQMMTMMEQMQGQMKRMHEQMAGMQGMGQMPGRMNRMMGMMGQMSEMMEQHRVEMQRGCPAMSAPGPRQGG